MAAFVWQFRPDQADRPTQFTPQTLSSLTWSKESVALAKALKKRGWTFVGPTNMYAMMQSVGIVNDHYTGCHHRELCEEAMRNFTIPGN